MSPSPARPTVESCIGHTPLLDLARLARHCGLPPGTRLLAKAEHLNPGGSGKDRLAAALLGRAEREGLRPGATVVEATSGNTGIALAQLCAARGYALHVVCSEKASDEKVRILAAFGATVHRTPVVPHGHPGHYIESARRLAIRLGAHFLDQFGSPANTAVHEDHTGPEIVGEARARHGRLDAFVAGVGTGGSLTGIARHLRHASPATRVVLADPVGSVLAAGGEAAGYLVEGIGDDALPALYDPGLVDEAVPIGDRESFRFALLAARLEGILVGGSSGTHLAAAVDVARRLPAGAVVATLLPDTGRNYLSKFLDAAWCARNGLADLHASVAAELATVPSLEVLA
ncbi:MAG TPA: cysteine synthase family protein [Candidatus Thermoplasmatota archaeon]|nr:cysteine synthase family protein [Candidatus Thermoplasmatota archaeon]